MHRLLSVNEAVATRNLELKNLKTATTDWCFDDSALTSFENFDFMEIGEEYNCSIYLFGICSEDGEYFNYIKNVKIGIVNYMVINIGELLDSKGFSLVMDTGNKEENKDFPSFGRTSRSRGFC